MASPVPAKSQPLHNFPLAHLKWKSSHQRPRSSPHRSPPNSHNSPQRQLENSDSAQPPPPPQSSKPLIEYRRQSRNNNNSVMGFVEEKSENKESKPSKILIKIRQISSKIPEEIQVEKDVKVEDVNEAHGEEEGEEERKLLGVIDEDDFEPIPKTWNLRPRRPIRASLNMNGNSNNNGSKVQEKRIQVNHNNNSSSSNNNTNNNRSENQKKEKRKIEFTPSLSREEIEEDIYALIGSKPSRRPKKRSKILQKIIDNLFPGAWLQSVTADSYKVSEHPVKV